MKEFLILNIPCFRVPYEKHIKYGYQNARQKENLKNVLGQASGGYCMYCYSRIQVDGKYYGNLEHAIEKTNSARLVECIPNIGLACPTCNQTFKRIGEKKRKLPQAVTKQFEEDSTCPDQTEPCMVPCKALREMQHSYEKMPEAEIILQPMGSQGEQTGEPLEVQYNVIKMEFEPDASQHTYSEEEKRFINRHIQRFRLNDPKYRTRQLADFMKNIIDNHGNMQKYEYNNRIVQLFAEKLEGKTAEEKMNICSKLYTMMFLRL